MWLAALAMCSPLARLVMWLAALAALLAACAARNVACLTPMASAGRLALLAALLAVWAARNVAAWRRWYRQGRPRAFYPIFNRRVAQSLTAEFLRVFVHRFHEFAQITAPCNLQPTTHNIQPTTYNSQPTTHTLSSFHINFTVRNTCSTSCMKRRLSSPGAKRKPFKRMSSLVLGLRRR